MIFRRLLAMALVILLLVPAFAPAVSVAADGECDTGEQYFPETKKCVPAVFSAYWRSHGGLAQQGLPVTDVLWEISEVDGKEYLVQYFERARFEQHPEQADPQYQVLLGLLGLEQYQDEALGDSPANPDGACAAGERFFAETRHCVPALFYTYWQGHGGLAQQGLPLSDPFLETNPTDGKEYLTQYFERARFEAHPENQAPYDVLLGLLGREQVLAKYPGDAADEPEPPTAGPGPALPAPAPPMPGEVLDTDAKPVISWSVHARYQASWDAAGRGATAYAAYANPSRWGIILNGCNSTSRYKITQYTFTIVEVNGDYKRTVSYPKVCNLTLSNALPRQGQYRVSLTLHTAHPVGPGVSLAATRLATIHDLLIVSMGDSLASGEGNPDRPGKPSANVGDPCGPPPNEVFTKIPDYACVQRTTAWKNRRCHRSANSGPARAAKALENDSRYTSVTFVSVACSGAGIANLIDDSYGGVEKDRIEEDPQIDRVAALVGGRTIDALLLSVGLNEIGFSDIIYDCAAKNTYNPAHTSCGKGPGIDAKVASLSGSYDRLNAALSMKLPRIRKTYLNDYPANAFKGGACGRLGDGSTLFPGYGIDEGEGAALQALGTRINGQINAATRRHGWNFVGGLTDVFDGHAYCDSTPWFVSWAKSMETQGNQSGTAHPTVAGHIHYGARLLQAIKSYL